MFLLYVDASGTPELQDQSKHYVLTGLCVHEGAWFAVEKRLQLLKSRYAFPGEEFELHAAEFTSDISEQAEVPDFENMSWTDRRANVVAIRQRKLAAETTAKKRAKRQKKYARTASFTHLTRRERSRLLEESLDLVGAHDGIRLFGEAVSKAHPGVTGGSIDPVSQAFEQVVARFDAFLRRVDAWKLQKGPRRKIDNGLLILDADKSNEATIDNHYRGFRVRGHSWGPLQHVMDVPFFASSERVSGLQLVDVCAFAVRRYLDKRIVAGSHEEVNFQRVFQRFDRDARGRLHGLRHYVPANTCTCMICQVRGHGQ
jgi:hypothetical protein